MTHHPIIDSADLTAALPARSLEGEERPAQVAQVAQVARAYAVLLAARPFRLTTPQRRTAACPRDPVPDPCEHHMLPFSCAAHVGYLPGERILRLSRLARLIDHFAARLQTQEQLTMQIAKCLAANLRFRGVGVVLEADQQLAGFSRCHVHDRAFWPIAGRAPGARLGPRPPEPWIRIPLGPAGSYYPPRRTKAFDTLSWPLTGFVGPRNPCYQ